LKSVTGIQAKTFNYERFLGFHELILESSWAKEARAAIDAARTSVSGFQHLAQTTAFVDKL
jgi:hypothetical protein